MGGYTETIARGAFRKSLDGRPDVMLLVNHDGLPLARTTIPSGMPGHLSLAEDDRGLYFDAQLDRSDPDAAVLMRKVGSGLMDQCSFAFRVIKQDWSDDRTQRTIREVSLDRGDVSVVNYGASPVTSVDARGRPRTPPGPAIGGTSGLPSPFACHAASRRSGDLAGPLSPALERGGPG